MIFQHFYLIEKRLKGGFCTNFFLQLNTIPFSILERTKWSIAGFQRENINLSCCVIVGICEYFMSTLLLPTYFYQAKHLFMFCYYNKTFLLVVNCVYSFEYVQKYTQIILHVFVLLGLSCGWTVNDNSHVVRLLLFIDDLGQILAVYAMKHTVFSICCCLTVDV